MSEDRKRKLRLLQMQAQAKQAPQISPEEQAERDRMIAISEARMTNGADIESATAQDGLTLDPRTGTYKNRNATVEGYEPTRAEAAMGGGMQGLGLNYGDEAVGALASVVEGPEMGALRREQMRGRLERQEQAFPYTFGGSEIAGNVATAAAALPAATAPTMLGTMGRGAALGAAEGFAYGTGQGEGLQDRLSQGVDYAQTGAAVGGVAPLAVGALARGGRAVMDMASGGIDTVLNRGSNSRARRAIVESLSRSGRSMDDVANEVGTAALEGQPEFRLMDALGVAGQRRASGVVRSGGDGAEELAQFLQQRQMDQGDRVARFVDEGFGMGGKTAQQTADAMTAARSSAADTAYSAARGNAAPVDVRGALSIIDDRIGGMSGSGVAGDSIDGRLASFRSRLAAGTPPNGEISRELSDFDRVLGVKQDVQDAIGAAVRAGRNNEARELGKLSSALDEALEASSDMYRTANDGFRTASRNIDAIDQGAAMVSPQRRADDVVQEFGAMTPDQQTGARVGYGDRRLAQIEANAAPTANKAKPFTSTKAQAEAQAMTVDPQLFSNRIGRESSMWEVQNRALGGSRTADNLEDIANVGPASNVVRALRSALNFQGGEAIANLGAAVGPAMTGQNEATRTLVAKMLMSNDPATVLAPALRAKETSEAAKRIVEALMRNSGREPAYSAMIPR